MSDFQYQVGDVVRFVEYGYNKKQQKGMTAIVRALSATRYPIVDSDFDGETLGWGSSVEFVSRPSDTPQDTLTIRDHDGGAEMSGKHTPGPLAVFPEHDREWLWVMDELGTKRVARVVLYHDLKEEMEANARLIAAAPDLLEALKELVDYPEDMIPSRIWDSARQAISRATGDA